MALIAVGGAGIGDDDRPISQVACSARGGFDGDVSGYPGKNNGVDAGQAENGVQHSPVEPVGRLPPDERFIGPPGEFVNELDRGSTLQRRATCSSRKETHRDGLWF